MTHNNRNSDQGELVNIISVIWKRKFFIIGGIILITIISFGYVATRPKISMAYIDLLSGVKGIDGNKRKVFIENPEDLEMFLNGEFVHDLLVKRLQSDGIDTVGETLGFRVVSYEDALKVRIIYLTKNKEIGIRILQSISRIIEDNYEKNINKIIEVSEAVLKENQEKIDTLKAQIENLEKSLQLSKSNTDKVEKSINQILDETRKISEEIHNDKKGRDNEASKSLNLLRNIAIRQNNLLLNLYNDEYRRLNEKILDEVRWVEKLKMNVALERIALANEKLNRDNIQNYELIVGPDILKELKAPRTNLYFAISVIFGSIIMTTFAFILESVGREERKENR